MKTQEKCKKVMRNNFDDNKKRWANFLGKKLYD